MLKSLRTNTFWLAILASLAATTSILQAAATLTQPVAPVRPVTDDYFGTKVVDNYRWMEDLKNPEVQAWMKGQSDFTKDYLAKLPGRDEMVKRIEGLDNAAIRVGDLQFFNGRYFYYKLTPADQTPKLYTREGLDGKETLLVDPQVLGGDAKRYTISEYHPSLDGKLVAVEIAAGGSEEGWIRVIDVATAKPLSDKIDRVWGSGVTWDPSGKMFYFTRLQELGAGKTKMDKELDDSSYVHHLGDDASKDMVVMNRVAYPELGMIPTDEGFVGVQLGCPYAIGVVGHGVKNELTAFICPAEQLQAGKPKWVKICDVDDDVTSFAAKGNDLWLITHKDAPHFKVIHMDLSHPDITKADTVMPASDLIVKTIATAKDGLYIESMKGGLSHLSRIAYDKPGAPTEIKLPFEGSVNGLFTDIQMEGALVRLAGWTHAPQWYTYDPGKDTLTDTNIEPMNPTDFSGITSAEVEAPSADGTMVPLSIIYKKDLKMDGSNPCLMEGYGAYGITIDPGFDATRLALLEKGIIIAYAHPRGGGENGEDWHLGGMKLTKQNTISDMIGCAEYLENKGYTSPSKLAGRGTSAGGITIGGALTQRPDLFALAICNVGVMNALRSEAGPNGAPNTPEFGSVKDADGAKGLLVMDALNHVKPGTPYPFVLLITGANDPRVDPWELFKMTAALQAATSSKNPVLLRIDYDAGHGMGSSKYQRDAITADQATLLLAIAAKTAPLMPAK